MSVIVRKFLSEPVFALGLVEAVAVSAAVTFPQRPIVVGVSGFVVGVCELVKRSLVTPNGKVIKARKRVL